MKLIYLRRWESALLCSDWASEDDCNCLMMLINFTMVLECINSTEYQSQWLYIKVVKLVEVCWQNTKGDYYSGFLWWHSVDSWPHQHYIHSQNNVIMLEAMMKHCANVADIIVQRFTGSSAHVMIHLIPVLRLSYPECGNFIPVSLPYIIPFPRSGFYSTPSKTK